MRPSRGEDYTIFTIAVDHPKWLSSRAKRGICTFFVARLQKIVVYTYTKNALEPEAGITGWGPD